MDATEVIANRANAKWTYKNNKGYMSMVGHITQTGKMVATGFRVGNMTPAKDNLAFIQHCRNALPIGIKINKLRMD